MADDADAADSTVDGPNGASTRTVTRSVNESSEPDDAPGEREAMDDADTAAAVDAELTTEDADAEPTAEDDDADSDVDRRDEAPARIGTPGFRLAVAVGLGAILALGGLAGWLGYDTYQGRQAELQRNRFLAVGKQGALNLTTINYTQANADVQRILDSATGQFYDDFSKRAPAFIDVVKQAQAKTQGSITEAGVESISGDSARVLVAVAVDTSNAGAADQSPRHWRMRIDVQKVGDTVKVSNVGFVP